MTNATCALLKPTSEERVMNTDHPRVYWEQSFAHNKKGHYVDSQSSGDRDIREFSGGKYNTQEATRFAHLAMDWKTKQHLTLRLSAHAPRTSRIQLSSSPGKTSVVLPRNGSPVLNDREPYVHDCYLIRALSTH